MGYEFFLSYTRGNNDAYLKAFFNDISNEIAGRRGLRQDQVVGFFDQQDLELGEEWDPKIVQALQTSRVFIAIWSPGYFKSEYCGKEWAVFQQRLAASVVPGQPQPPLMKPVIWIPVETTKIPASLGSGHFTLGDPGGLHNIRGFKYLLKQKQQYLTEYNDLVESLAKEMIKAADNNPLPPPSQVPKLKQVSSAFSSPPVPAAVSRPPSGPKHIRFVYVAESPNNFGAARSSDAYIDVGGPDWKPFFPAQSRPIHQVLQNFVSQDELGFSSDEVRFGADLIAQVEAAWNQRQIVVLVIDGWSVHWNSQYRDILQQLDQRLDYHWCVLVPWNNQDAESLAVREKIQEAVSKTFDRHANLAPNPLFFRAGIGSLDELKNVLGEILTRLKEEIKKRAPVEMPVPPGPSKSNILGPSGKR
jgi:FxsC-like protein